MSLNRLSAQIYSLAISSLTNLIKSVNLYIICYVEVQKSKVTVVQAVAKRCGSERGDCRRARGARASGLAENIRSAVTYVESYKPCVFAVLHTGLLF